MVESSDPALRLDRLSLTQFRNYPALTWRPARRIVALFGPNGSGKTNLLEAISVLVPGRGLRGARGPEMARHGDGATGVWAVAGRFATPMGACDIGTGTPPEGPTDRRVFRLDGVAPRSQAELAARVSAVWLTPRMDRLFHDGAAARRRFLDRLVYALEPGHAREVAAHDSAMAQRNRLLSAGRRDRAWLDGLEEQMARHAVAATAARAVLVDRLNTSITAGAADPFPRARLELLDPVAGKLAGEPALAVEDWLRGELANRRDRDTASGGATLGAHRADMGVSAATTGLPGVAASTGQQKALLIGVVLGHAALLAEARGFSPLLLLDEPAVHLDPGRRTALFGLLTRLPAHVFLTGTDRDTFLPLRGIAEGLRVEDGSLHVDPHFY